MMFRRNTANSLWSKGYIPGDNWMMCDICGRRFRASHMRVQPHGLHRGFWVCPKDFDKFNPQFEPPLSRAERIVPKKLNPEPTITTISSPITADDF